MELQNESLMEFYANCPVCGRSIKYTLTQNDIVAGGISDHCQNEECGVNDGGEFRRTILWFSAETKKLSLPLILLG